MTSRLNAPPDTTAWFESYLSPQSDAIFSFYADRITWWNPSPTFQHGEVGITYTGTIDPQKLVDITTWSDAPQVFQWRNFTTASIGLDHLYFYKEIVRDTQRRKISEQFDVLLQQEDDWDVYESKKPTELTLAHAKLLMEELLDSISAAGYSLLTPFISTDEDGYITVEWHKGKRELHFDIEENEAEYTKISGSNPNMKIHTDYLNRDDYLTLWKWLLDE